MKSDRPNNHGKTKKTPRRPFGKERLDKELELCGKFGLKCKRELWRVELMLSKIRRAAGHLLTLNEKDKRRIFEGSALINRLSKLGVLNEDERKLDYILQLTSEDLLDKRLQTQVEKLHQAKSIHHARVVVRQGHICVNKRTVNVPSFLVHVTSSKHIEFDSRSPMHPSGGKQGRVARKNNKRGAAAEE